MVDTANINIDIGQVCDLVITAPGSLETLKFRQPHREWNPGCLCINNPTPYRNKASLMKVKNEKRFMLTYNALMNTLSIKQYNN